VRLYSAVAIVALGEGGKRPLTLIAQALDTEDDDFRSEVIHTLGDLGLKSVPILVDSLRAKKASIRWSAAASLGSVADNVKATKSVLPRQAILALIKTLRDEDEDVRYTAVYALSRYGQAANEAVPEITKCLKDGEWSVRWIAARHLRDFGPAAVSAIPALKEALQDEDERVRSEAAAAIKLLEQMRPKKSEEGTVNGRSSSNGRSGNGVIVNRCGGQMIPRRFRAVPRG